MSQYPDNYFDLAIVDPPYFSGPEKKGYFGNEISTHGVKRIDYPITDTWEFLMKNILMNYLEFLNIK